jgi:hypothetical protein
MTCPPSSAAPELACAMWATSEMCRVVVADAVVIWSIDEAVC